VAVEPGVHHAARVLEGVKRASSRPLSSVNSTAPAAPNTVNWFSTLTPMADVGIQRAQVEATRSAATIQLRQERAQRMSPVELVGAVRGDEHDPLGSEVSHQEREQVARGAIRPVQVLEHEHQRAVVCHSSQQPEGKLEQASLSRRADRRRRPGCGSAQIGQQAGELRTAGRQELLAARVIQIAGVAPQRLDERAERQSTLLHVDTAADQGGRAGPGRAGNELLGEPGLPDPRLATHHEQLGPACHRRLQPVLEPPQLLLAAHETPVRRHVDHPCAPAYPAPRRTLPPAAAEQTSGLDNTQR
jgi:hypothetical protein